MYKNAKIITLVLKISYLENQIEIIKIHLLIV